MICVSSCPARPTNGSPCSSSSAPGPSPTNISVARRDCRRRTRYCVRPLCSLQRVQSPISARIASETDAAALRIRCDGCAEVAVPPVRRADAPVARASVAPASDRRRVAASARRARSPRRRDLCVVAQVLPRDRGGRSRAGFGRRWGRQQPALETIGQGRGRDRLPSTAAAAASSPSSAMIVTALLSTSNPASCARHVVGDDDVDALPQALARARAQHVVRSRRQSRPAAAVAPLALPPRRDVRQDVRRRHSVSVSG